MSEKLSSCPFCGEKAEMKSQRMVNGEGACEHAGSTLPVAYVECTKCFSTGPVTFSMEASANGWNQRAMGVM